MRIGLVTNKDNPNLYPDDQLLKNHLISVGFQVNSLIWNDPQVSWSEWDMLIIRSVWDYHLYPLEFRQWLEMIKQLKAPVFNNTEIIQANMHKSYLLKFKEAGLNTIPTQLLKKGEAIEYTSFVASQSHEEYIVKPAVSLSAYNTYRIHRDNFADYNDILQKMLIQEDVLLQPFFSEIITEGETSLIFFNGNFSHAVKKLPKVNDFRVQTEYGGTRQKIKPPRNIIDAAKKYIDHLNEVPLYARVDGIIIKGVFWLMELELIDPVLHFDLHPKALHDFTEALPPLEND